MAFFKGFWTLTSTILKLRNRSVRGFWVSPKHGLWGEVTAAPLAAGPKAPGSRDGRRLVCRRRCAHAACLENHRITGLGTANLAENFRQELNRPPII